MRMKMRNVRAPYNIVLGVAVEDIKKGAAIEQVPDLPPLTAMKWIDVACPYCLYSQTVKVLPNQPTVISCKIFTCGCPKNYLVELVDKPIIKISMIDRK